MKWTNQAWEKIQPIYGSILQMPFIQELQNGTLALDKFQFYMQQDSKYLEHYGRALAALGAKAKDNQMALDFFEFGKNALIVESALHASYFEEFGLQPHAEIPMEPVCHHYVHYLKSTVAYDPIEVAVAAILPCFWIYQEVGNYILQKETANNPYQKWIDTYSSEEFAEGVRKAQYYADLMADNTTEALKEQMFEAFVKASQLEFQFWEAAYTNRTW